MKNLNVKTLAGIVLAVAVLGGGVYMAMGSDRPEAVTAEIAPASGEDLAVTKTEAPTKQTATTSVSYDNAVISDDPLGDRSLGNPDAPVKIEEFASLSCGHCAQFHKTIFPEFKAKYIDTGKVFFTFTDFPLNAPALDGTLITRCMPPARYFPFLSMLFDTQEKWAFSEDYKNNLRQNAKLAGMSDEAFDTCLADTKMKEGIVAKIQDKQRKHGISSTPSFVINGSTVVTGALPIAAFDQAIEEAMKPKTDTSTPAPAPAAEPVKE